MSTTIEQLELEVQSNATSAVSGVDALASSLCKLKTAVNCVERCQRYKCRELKQTCTGLADAFHLWKPQALLLCGYADHQYR